MEFLNTFSLAGEVLLQASGEFYVLEYLSAASSLFYWKFKLFHMFLVGFFRKKPSSLRQIARVESQLSLCKIGMCQSLVFQEKTQLKCELMNLFKIGPWKVTVKETKLYSYLVISLKVSFMIWGSHSWFILNTWGLAAPSLYRTRGMWYTICFCWFWEF